MADTYLETLTKLQHQSLDMLKNVQEAQLQTLTSIRDMVAGIEIPAVPTSESLPALDKVVELNTQFATAIFEQQKAYATQLTSLFGTIQKDATEAMSRFTKPAASNN